MRAIVPPHLADATAMACMSPAIASHGHVFVTGMTGSGPDGAMPDDPAAQFHAAFDKIGVILAQADLTLGDLVEMTSYHVDIGMHFDTFDRVRIDRLSAPYPAWTAVEVAGLRRPGALVEVRAVAAERVTIHAPDGPR